MKVAYHLEWSEGSQSGVFKKVVAQTHYWAEHGLEVQVFVLSNRDTSQEWRSHLDARVRLSVACWDNRFSRFREMNKLVNTLLAWKPNLVYRRYQPYYPFYEKIFRRVKVILEINTNELKEARLYSRHQYWYRRLTRWRQLRHAAGLVFVSHELAADRQYTVFKKPTVVIANGVDLDQFTTFPAPNNENPHLVFIGSAKIAWNGLDKLLVMARHFPNWQFDVIGPSIKDFDEALPPNVIAHGWLQQVDYEPILAQADVSIGTLSLHRKAMCETSALKVPEYLAYGIPIILGYKETNLMEPVDFVLELPSTPENVASHLGEIKKFVEQSKGKRVPRAAIQHVHSAAKEQERIAFFNQILGSSVGISQVTSESHDPN